ncbi:DUF3017 domain-containing protein [Streptomyces sp. SP18CS02]|uniref:DUF3017 domain-containing protein n=1 Tax=Streptomyces sp. SP18CS02 TaxID=3002531 RepID=UPI002E76BFD4|nr:DUF3017 domain-containing protein [Streptomyces sp. SP18CS02]MEE1756125.1 DUF3017 domain-containing protein [Streptomyces sp. SP18CS02]
MGVRANDDPATTDPAPEEGPPAGTTGTSGATGASGTPGTPGDPALEGGAQGRPDAAADDAATTTGGSRSGAAPEPAASGTAGGTPPDSGTGSATTGEAPGEPASGGQASGEPAPGGDGASADGDGPPPGARSRRPPALTRDTARPEGGGRAAPGDAPAPARQWPLLTVLGLTALGLLVVGFDPFPQAPRVGTILVGVALLTGAALRRALPSVGMLAVRSRFTDMVTYGLLGVVIVLLALMTQPGPWLEMPFLEEAVHFTVR